MIAYGVGAAATDGKERNKSSPKPLHAARDTLVAIRLAARVCRRALAFGGVTYGLGPSANKNSAIERLANEGQPWFVS